MTRGGHYSSPWCSLFSERVRSQPSFQTQSQEHAQKLELAHAFRQFSVGLRGGGREALAGLPRERSGEFWRGQVGVAQVTPVKHVALHKAAHACPEECAPNGCDVRISGICLFLWDPGKTWASERSPGR